MPGLASHLVGAFSVALPSGWRAEAEYPLLYKVASSRLGHVPHADLVLHAPSERRLALEFEISRADPVANQAKVLVAYESGALTRDDVFVSLLSPHLQRGRRNLAAMFTRYMGALGLPAFGVHLLPGHTGAEIANLNQLRQADISVASGAIAGELQRVFDVVESRGETQHRIHFAGDATDAVANL